MSAVRRSLCTCLVVFACISAFGQSRTELPRVVRYSGTLKNVDGSPRTGTFGITFSIYADESSTAPLYQEVQNVVADAAGHYTALLGVTRSEGLPAQLFATNDARWLGIRVESEQEQPRALLAAVPYALKAADAETLGGKPLSAFVLNEAASGQSGANGSSGANSGSGSIRLQPLSINTSGSSGTQNFLAMWTDNAGTLGNSTLVESNGMIGVGKVPSLAALDVVSTGNAVAVDSSASNFSALIATSNGGKQVAINNMNGEMGFFTASGEVARFNSVGMGVGKPASLASLDVNGSAAFAGRGMFTTGQSFGGNISTLRVADSSPVAANVGGGLVFGGTYTGTSTTEFAALVASKDNGTDGSYGGGLGFYTRADGSGAWTPKTDARMFITSAGNVGVGTTSPVQKLDVNGSINASGNVAATGAISATSFSGNGANLTNLSFAAFSGTLPNASLSGTYSNALTLSNASNSFTGNGANLTNLAAGNLTGTIPNASFSGTYSNAVALSNVGNAYAGNGSALTNVAAAAVGSVAASVANLRLITYLGGCDSCSALTTSDNQNLIYQNLLGAPLSLVSITCYSDAGTPSINIQRDNGSTANVTASAVGCSTAGNTVLNTGGNFTITSLAANEKLNFLMSTPDGSAHRVTVIIKTTL